jgi:hypothetical protein
MIETIIQGKDKSKRKGKEGKKDKKTTTMYQMLKSVDKG